MAQRRFHYDRAFEHYLRANGIPYVAVDEARRAIQGSSTEAAAKSLKNFDFVVYSESGANLLIDVKGRKHSGKTGNSFQNWVTAGDVDSLTRWKGIFGEGFEAAFVFLFWCESQPPDALFSEVYEFGDRWYMVLTVTLEDYRAHMKTRSPKWQTVHLPAKDFMRLSRPLVEML